MSAEQRRNKVEDQGLTIDVQRVRRGVRTGLRVGVETNGSLGVIVIESDISVRKKDHIGMLDLNEGDG